MHIRSPSCKIEGGITVYLPKTQTMSISSETYNAMVLSNVRGFSLTGMLQLYREVGSATAIVENHADIKALVPDASSKLVEALKDIENVKEWASREAEYAESNKIQVLSMDDASYPQRLLHCDDAPLVLFYLGNADLNARRVVNIVGTRHCTSYGKDLIRHFVADLKKMCPDTLVVSGLAYGVDVCAHREALGNGMETVGVLAHGLDTIYPTTHRDVAAQMVSQGGLLTEYASHSRVDKGSFVRRNRIVAGVSDACILVESAAHGGGLITAGISRDYNRDVFAFPGPVGAQYSEGCNNLIRDNSAALISSADDFVKAMGWESDFKVAEAQRNGIERLLFPNLTEDEQCIVDTLSVQNDLQINMLSVQSGLPIARLASLLFTLEMKGVVRTMAGGCYHLMN